VHAPEVDAPLDIDIVPTLQPKQLRSDVAPTPDEYMPAKQLAQLDNAELGPYVPAPQSVHDAAPDAEYRPEAQLVHTEGEAAPTVADAKPAAQLTHDVDAVALTVVEYVPEPQLVQLDDPTAA